MSIQSWMLQLGKEKACQHLGAPYNSSFYPDGYGFYCSQYIAEILPIFETIPMKFGDGGRRLVIFGESITGELGLPVPFEPAGDQSPSQLAASPLLECKERNLHDSDF